MATRNAWCRIIERFADGRQICNCGEAYLTPCGEVWINSERMTDYPICQYGCDSAQYQAKLYIADRVEAELKTGASRDEVDEH